MTRRRRTRRWGKRSRKSGERRYRAPADLHSEGGHVEDPVVRNGPVEHVDHPRPRQRAVLGRRVAADQPEIPGHLPSAGHQRLRQLAAGQRARPWGKVVPQRGRRHRGCRGGLCTCLPRWSMVPTSSA